MNESIATIAKGRFEIESAEQGEIVEETKERLSPEAPVDINGIITNIQRLVLSQSQETSMDRTTKKLSKIRDLVNCPDGTLSIRSSKFPVDHTAQLGDLQQQNSDLKAQYEDCIIALNSMMHVHRLEMNRFVNSKDKLRSNFILEERQKEIAPKIPLPIFQDLDDVFQVSETNQNKILEEIEDIRFENALIRELLQMEQYTNLNVDAILEKLENKTPTANSPSTTASQSEEEISTTSKNLQSQKTIKAKSEGDSQEEQ